MGSSWGRGTNFEFRVQKAKAPALPADPRIRVLRVLRIMPIFASMFGVEIPGKVVRRWSGGGEECRCLRLIDGTGT